ncbi:MAG: M23 family metallopeptidase [Micrococcaceae bacterium]
MIIADLVGIISPPEGIVWILGVVAMIVAGILLAQVAPRAEPHEPVQLQAPVRGRWLAINSPGQNIPSHGTRTRGQLCAVDLTHPTVTEDLITNINPSALRKGWIGSTPQSFTCFGELVYSMAAGTVVEASDGQQDQRARNTWISLMWMLTVESFLRDVLLGTRAVLGNRVIVRHDDGTFAAYAHLKRGSLAVRVGQRVDAGEMLAEVGNTGNTSEPHLHVQLMDRGNVDAAAGLTMVWSNLVLSNTDPAWEKHRTEPTSSALAAMPRNGQIFVVKR